MVVWEALDDNAPRGVPCEARWRREGDADMVVGRDRPAFWLREWQARAISVTVSLGLLATYLLIFDREAGSSRAAWFATAGLLCLSAWTVYVFRANSPSGSWQRVGEFIRRRRVPVFGDRTRLVALTSMTPALLPLCWSLAGSGLGFHRLQAGRGLVLVVLGGLAIQGAAVVAASWVLELLRGIEHKKWLRRREQRKRDCPHSYSFRPLTGVRLTMEAGYDPPDGHMVCSLCGHEYPIGGGKRRPDLP